VFLEIIQSQNRRPNNIQKGPGAPLLGLSKYVLDFICVSNVSSALALMGNTFQARIRIWKYWFLRRGENQRSRGKTSRSREENQEQTQPTYDAGSGNRTRGTLVGGERACALTAAPSLLPAKYKGYDRVWKGNYFSSAEIYFPCELRFSSLFSANITTVIFSREKTSCFRAKAHLVFLLVLIQLEIVFTIAVPAFDILFIGCVLNIKIAYTTAEK